MPLDLASFPVFESRYPPANQYRVIPLIELIKIQELIFNQIDWSEVIQEAGGRENPDTYRDIFKTIIYSHIKKLLKQKEYGKDIKIEFNKRGNKDTDTESKNNNNKEGGGDSFRYFKDNTFLESDKGKYGSEDYINNETNYKEDSDDKD